MIKTHKISTNFIKHFIFFLENPDSKNLNTKQNTINSSHNHFIIFNNDDDIIEVNKENLNNSLNKKNILNSEEEQKDDLEFFLENDSENINLKKIISNSFPTEVVNSNLLNLNIANSVNNIYKNRFKKDHSKELNKNIIIINLQKDDFKKIIKPQYNDLEILDTAPPLEKINNYYTKEDLSGKIKICKRQILIDCWFSILISLIGISVYSLQYGFFSLFSPPEIDFKHLHYPEYLVLRLHILYTLSEMLYNFLYIRRQKFWIEKRRLYFSVGIFSQQKHSVPLASVVEVTLKQDWKEMLLGIYRVNLFTPMGSSSRFRFCKIEGLNLKQAEYLRERVEHYVSLP